MGRETGEAAASLPLSGWQLACEAALCSPLFPGRTDPTLLFSPCPNPTARPAPCQVLLEPSLTRAPSWNHAPLLLMPGCLSGSVVGDWAVEETPLWVIAPAAELSYAGSSSAR